MRLKFGLEKEFFCFKDGKAAVVPLGFSADSCGWLAEARGGPFMNIVDAVYSLQADVHKLHTAATAAGIKLNDVPVMKLDRGVKVQASRKYSKGLISYQNLYGHADHKNSDSEAVAGVHISFTCPETIVDADGIAVERYRMFDWAQIFLGLDKAFAVEIKAAKRNPGMYELKPNGRIEYRSLPSNVDLNKVIAVVLELTK